MVCRHSPIRKEVPIGGLASGSEQPLFIWKFHWYKMCSLDYKKVTRYQYVTIQTIRALHKNAMPLISLFFYGAGPVLNTINEQGLFVTLVLWEGSSYRTLGPIDVISEIMGPQVPFNIQNMTRWCLHQWYTCLSYRNDSVLKYQSLSTKYACQVYFAAKRKLSIIYGLISDNLCHSFSRVCVLWIAFGRHIPQRVIGSYHMY